MKWDLVFFSLFGAFCCLSFLFIVSAILTSGRESRWEESRERMKPERSLVFAVDFDGLLCVENYPDIGRPHIGAIEHFKDLRIRGHKLILNTCREGELLDKAIVWCAEHGLYFDAHNENLPERIEQYGGDCRKISADFYADDRNYWLMPEGD